MEAYIQMETYLCYLLMSLQYKQLMDLFTSLEYSNYVNYVYTLSAIGNLFSSTLAQTFNVSLVFISKYFFFY